jgi:hypothetical protein
LLFWLAAGFVLGVLFPYLPSKRGALKGLLLAVVYIVTTGFVAWLFPGNRMPWCGDR